MVEERYRVIERLESGGMAEVFRGEALSVEGFKKPVAIKRVLPHLCQNAKFITMFLDEARLGARLNHANIVSMFDIGAADQTYFLVMEFVDGTNLKSLVDFFRESMTPFPIKEVLYIAMEVCRGLSYAHELTDDRGVSLHIVHRDVSPPNILLSKRGEVKVADFGLAKATTQLEKTDPGVVKGKFSYLSPEAATGQDVDLRADLFGLGIIIWEIIAGRRLFLGETDYDTVRLVQQATVPSLRGIRQDVDVQLEQLLMKSLSRDRSQRFQSARQFGDAIADYLFRHQLKVTSYDIAHLVETYVAHKKQLAPASAELDTIDRLIKEELRGFTSIEQGSAPLTAGGQPSNATKRTEGSQSFDGGSFENPLEWFDNSGELLQSSRDPQKSGLTADWTTRDVQSLLEDSDNAGGLSALLESEETAVRVHSKRTSGAGMSDATGSSSRKGQGRSQAQRMYSQPQKTSNTSKVWAIVLSVLLLMLAVGLGAWFYLLK